MKKRMLLPIGAVLLLLCIAALIAFGQTYTARLDETRLSQPLPETDENIRVEIENEDPGARITEVFLSDEALCIRFAAVKRGKTEVAVRFDGQPQTYLRVYTHLFGVLTCDSFFGDSTGGIAVPLAMLLMLVAILWYLVKKYRRDVRHSLYQYRNVMTLGLIVFLSFFFLNNVIQCFHYHGLIDAVDGFIDSMHAFSLVVLPVAFVVSLFVTASSVDLLRKEGRTWRNMLGVFLGVGVCLLTLMPDVIGEYLQTSPNAILDVHNQRGAGLYLETFVRGSISMLVTYLECILIGAVVFGIRAARHIPAFNKDYILILGCQINDDGTLPPLLRARADRALEFARLQKEKTGRDIVFVPSGGQGADEAMAEADAISRYLLSSGIDEERILPENKSANTSENIANSVKLIRAHAGRDDAAIAFSTTNYHVFRAGMLAETQGTPMEGIGSRTKRYFWINAFVREFIATPVSERKKHLLVIAAVTLLLSLCIVVKYLNVVL